MLFEDAVNCLHYTKSFMAENEYVAMVERYWLGKIAVLRDNTLKTHFVDHKSHLDCPWADGVPVVVRPVTKRLSYGTARRRVR